MKAAKTLTPPVARDGAASSPVPQLVGTRRTTPRIPATRLESLPAAPAAVVRPQKNGARTGEACLSEIAVRIRDFSIARWGPERPVELIGRHPSLLTVLEKAQKFARFNEPVLVTGESGTGKELFAKALHLLGWRRENPFVSMNCPQFHDGNTIVSELFGHRKGSFTGAVADHQGLFEKAHQGVIFLDEIADLPMAAQVILLRTLAEGEFRPLGCTDPRIVNVRAIAATNRPLEALISAKEFRNDLYFRLRYFRLDLPALRDRGDDWRLMLDCYLARLNAQHGTMKSFSDEALQFLGEYPWPGNVREVRGVVTMAFSLCDGATIELSDFAEGLEREAEPLAGSPNHGSEEGKEEAEQQDAASTRTFHQRLVEEKMGFWDLVHAPYMERDLNRQQVKAIIELGLQKTRGSYRKLAALYHMADDDYHKFMDFLRHHELKPD